MPVLIPARSLTKRYFFAASDITSGAELLHTYGDLSDGELLNTFGFVDTLQSGFKNPHNKVMSTSMLTAP